MSSKRTKVGVHAETKSKNTNEDIDRAREALYVTCRNGWSIALIILWTKKLPHQVKHPQASLVNRFIKNQRKVVSGEQSIFTHFPSDRNGEVRKRTKIIRGPLQKTHWQSSTSSRKVW